jgi:hypothetical protein
MVTNRIGCAFWDSFGYSQAANASLRQIPRDWQARRDPHNRGFVRAILVAVASPEPGASDLIAPNAVRAMPGFLRHVRHERHARQCYREDFGPFRRVARGATPARPLLIHAPHN